MPLGMEVGLVPGDFVLDESNLNSMNPLNGFAPNSQGRRVWSLALTTLNVKVKGQDHQGQKRYFSALSKACVRFTFGKTSLACIVIITLTDRPRLFIEPVKV